MISSTIKTPGVYINEIDAFPNSVVPVETAVPAFVGYTPQAMYEGKSYTNLPTKITSFAEFEAIFCFPKSTEVSGSSTKQYKPNYYLVAEKSQPTKGDFIDIDGTFYSILPDPNSIYYFYNSIRLFYENGGGDAYIVSVGSYGKSLEEPMALGEQIVNSNVLLNDLMAGFGVLKNEKEPTIYICPEATLLTVDDNANLMQVMLLQNAEMKTAISIFDVIGGRNPDPILYMDDIEVFMNNTGANGLSYGTAYYPFIGTSIMQSIDIDYTNLFGGDVKQLEPLLNPPSNPNYKVQTILNNIQSGTTLTVSQCNDALLAASTAYSSIIKHILSHANVLPPSGGMAGVITTTDNQSGPWSSPANASIVSATTLPIRLSEMEQSDLNMDAVSGKSINAIRYFNGLGILVWGARTLDGNSQDWRYVSVRRTMTYIEQSCKLAARAYVFASNDRNTWVAVKLMIDSFLTGIWKQGGLQGASAADAFSVGCGLGVTMTGDDILNGIMKVTIKVAVTHPTEFIELSFEQQMATN